MPNQGPPHLPFVKELLNSASGRGPNGEVLLTAKDLSDYSAKRRVDARKSNPHFSLSFFHKVFGSSKCVVPLIKPLSLFNLNPQLALRQC